MLSSCAFLILPARLSSGEDVTINDFFYTVLASVYNFLLLLSVLFWVFIVLISRNFLTWLIAATDRRSPKARFRSSNCPTTMAYEADAILEASTSTTRDALLRSPPYSSADDERPSKIRKQGSKLVSALRSFRNSGTPFLISYLGLVLMLYQLLKPPQLRHYCHLHLPVHREWVAYFQQLYSKDNSNLLSFTVPNSRVDQVSFHLTKASSNSPPSPRPPRARNPASTAASRQSRDHQLAKRLLIQNSLQSPRQHHSIRQTTRNPSRNRQLEREARTRTFLPPSRKLKWQKHLNLFQVS